MVVSWILPLLLHLLFPRPLLPVLLWLWLLFLVLCVRSLRLLMLLALLRLLLLRVLCAGFVFGSTLAEHLVR